MLTAAASRSLGVGLVVASYDDLHRRGYTAEQIRGHVRAHRWQVIGRAVVTHNGTPRREEMLRIALVNAGPRAALTSFTALTARGLEGWHRDPVHVIVPGGARVTRTDVVPLRVHWTNQWSTRAVDRRRRLDGVADSALLAASGLDGARAACGLLAATVQQGLSRAPALQDAIEPCRWIRHHAALLSAARDIAQGAQALSEIDFARLCRRHGLPEPTRQAARIERDGRRRYLDVQWTGRGGQRLVAEVDGALHLVAARWWNDQLRHNELVISGDMVLRFPTVVVRHEEIVVVDQLRRALARI